MQDYKHITLGEWLERWYTVYKKPYLTPSSMRNYEMIIRLHIPEELKAMALSDVTPIMLEKVIEDVTAPRMKQYVWQVLNNVFERATLYDIIDRNPMRLVVKVKHRQKRGSALSALELKEFKHKIKHHPFYRYINSRYLWFCMRLSCQNISYGGFNYKKGSPIDFLSISLDMPVKEGDDRLLGDVIASKKDYFERIPDEQFEEFDKFCETIAARLFPFSKAKQMAFYNSI